MPLFNFSPSYDLAVMLKSKINAQKNIHQRKKLLFFVGGIFHGLKIRLQGPNESPRTCISSFLNYTQLILLLFSYSHLQITSLQGSNWRKSIKKYPRKEKTTFFHSWDFPRTLQSWFFLHTQVIELIKLNKLDHLEVISTFNSRLLGHLEVVWICYFRFMLKIGRVWSFQLKNIAIAKLRRNFFFA